MVWGYGLITPISAGLFIDRNECVGENPQLWGTIVGI